MIKKILLLIALTSLLFLSLSCQTVEGVGGDIQWTAQKTAELLEN